MESTSDMMRARRPCLSTWVATAARSSRSFSGIASDLKMPATTTSSARARLTANSFCSTLRRIVFDRGSRIAQSRAPGYRERSALKVPVIAVGWCAKSSMIVMPFTCAFTSKRRLTLLNAFSAAPISSLEMP